jgi:hypothetical protein
MPQPRKHIDHAARQAAYRVRQTRAQQEQLHQRSLPPMPAIAAMPGAARWNAALQSARNLIEQVSQEMQAYYDDRSDAWQESGRGETFAERQEAIANLVSELELLTL